MSEDHITFDTTDTTTMNQVQAVRPLPSASKAEVLAAAKSSRKEITVELPSMECTVLLREMTGSDHDGFVASMQKDVGYDDEKLQRVKETDLTNTRAKLVARCWIDVETNERMFSDSEVDELGTLPTSAMQTLADASMKINGLSDDDIEEMAGNSEAIHGDDS